jgi:hypothetical protein
MEFIVANVDNIKFDIEVALEEQYGALPLPFAGMDSKYLFSVILTSIATVKTTLRVMTLLS